MRAIVQRVALPYYTTLTGGYTSVTGPQEEVRDVLFFWELYTYWFRLCFIPKLDIRLDRDRHIQLKQNILQHLLLTGEGAGFGE